MDDIVIPMEIGNMEDIAHETPVGSENASNSSHNTSSLEQFDRESRIKIDYRHLPRSLRDVEDADDVKKQENSLQKSIRNLQETVTHIQAPNLKAIQKLEQASGKLQTTNEELENARKKAKKAKSAFEKVQRERLDKFMACFEYVANEIDPIYKVCLITRSPNCGLIFLWF